MSSNSIFTSIKSEKRWVLSMNKNFPQQHIVDIDFPTPPCVTTVPKSLTEEKAEAYAPQNLGLGPYHHLRPEIYTMQSQKLAAIRKFLGTEKLQKFQQVINALVQMEPVLRACYDRYLDLDIDTLAWIMAIDGVYLLQFLKNDEQDSEIENLTGDVLMLENQIPVILLKKIRRVLEISPVDDDYSLFEEFQSFCLEQSPLQLLNYHVGNMDEVHLLHFMYYMIVNNKIMQTVPFTTLSSAVTRISVDNAVDAVDFLAERGLPGAETAGKILSFVKQIPWDKILGLCKKDGLDEQNPSVTEIDIPSVSQMSEIAGIKFTLTPGGIRNVVFEDHGETKKFYLPVIKLNHTSEIILRNLVAYEAASAKAGSTLEFAEYVDLMCGIVDSPKDVDILKKEKIIESELGDEDIARMFNGIGKSTKKKGDKSNIEEAIDNVNTTYDNLCGIKVKRFMEKYVYISLKFLSVVVSVAVAVLIVLQAFCSVFGCDRWFGHVTAQRESLLFSY
ncbi:hypothetical protein CDL12_07006 [Handroanthus impetiginosus]|uniref:Uncharacterized protein n=1 Tax=Handroanthus impetiginosus TaxID=429701 RepID=A0A2G9HS24_9LAMI|nr:hypothetical protein CDL12_07006 [Handroanthus impetiginosus]